MSVKPENEKQDNIDDTILVFTARLGGKNAFGLLSAKYFGAMYTIAHRICDSPSCAEDVVQDSLLLAYRSLSSLRNPARFGAWLHSITRNSATRLMRSNQREKLVPFNENEETLVRASERAHCDLVDRWARNNRVVRIRRAVEELPAEFREPIELRFWCEMRITEIAKFTSLPESTIKWRIYRAKIMLREKMTIDEKE
jgi:RNA polymerase sigma-70 factor, ECF subfamily